MADEADAADPLQQHRGLPVGVALDELLVSTELDDVQPRVDDLVVVVEVDDDLAVALDPRDGVDDELSAHEHGLRSVETGELAG